MSEFIGRPDNKKALLKHMIMELHAGEAPEEVKKRLQELLKSIPYDQVVEVEQELISEGLPEEEVLKFCDIHTSVLEGHIDQTGAKPVPPGHPVDTFRKENRELERVADEMLKVFENVDSIKDDDIRFVLLRIRAGMNALMDVDKHYLRKEYLVFPYLEAKGITGPPKVMWGKHDEERELLKAAIEVLGSSVIFTKEELKSLIGFTLKPAVQGIFDMIMKEEEILFPMCMDKLTDSEWYSVYEQTMEFGYCLYDPQVEWKPENVEVSEVSFGGGTRGIKLSTGSFSTEEMEALFSTLPIDVTFVDKDDKVKFFSLGPDRIFVRNRAIIGRDVRMCHPPSSVDVVEQILADFKSGKESTAAFWINFQGRFIYIEYIALRDKKNEYLGTIEFTQDLTHLRELKGEQRLLSYGQKNEL
ncbi:MAG: DUF438 domain-containing protein [Bacteroidales bacterium]|nr:DUF438 domain-containing protein [Bacteroidales bacterium]